MMNKNLTREQNRVLYLVNEMLQDMSSFVPLDRKIVIIYNDRNEIEDYDYPNLDGEKKENINVHFAIYEREVGEETTLKQAFFYFLSIINPNLPYESVVLLGIRLICGLSQVEMARKIGITKQAFFTMETGKRKVSKNVREKICFLCKDFLDRYNFDPNDFDI